MTRRGEMAIGCLLAWVLAVGLLSGCGTWGESAGKTLQAVHEVAKAASAKVEPGYRVKCMAVAKACKASPCEALEVCQAERRKVNAAIRLTHASVKAMTEVLPLIEEVSK